MTRTKLENILKTYEITKPNYRDNRAERRSFPDMLITFRRMMKNGIPPTQNAFVAAFLVLHPHKDPRGITARLQRAYLSYVRECHLGYLLEEEFKVVIYDEGLDIAGTDYLIIHNGNTYYIHAFVDTKMSRYWRKIKNSRHNYQGNHVDMPLDLCKGRHVGKFLLYRKVDVDNLRMQMEDSDKIIKDQYIRRSEDQSHTKIEDPDNSKIVDQKI